jgi:hypothetical protein
MKAYGGVDVYINTLLNFILVGVEWSASRLGRFTPGGKTPDTHWIVGWVCPTAGLDDVEKETFLTPSGLGTPTPSVAKPGVSRHADYAIPAHLTSEVKKTPWP